eukprot:352084-Chlamydomonas_euryale.AAC.1
MRQNLGARVVRPERLAAVAGVREVGEHASGVRRAGRAQAAVGAGREYAEGDGACDKWRRQQDGRDGGE